MASSRHHSSRGRAHSVSSRGGGSEGGRKKLPPIPERSPSSGRKMVGVDVERERGTVAKNRRNLAGGSGILGGTEGIDLRGERDRVSIAMTKYRMGRGREVVVPPSPEKRLRDGRDVPVATVAVAVAEARDDEDDRPPASVGSLSSAAAAKGTPSVVAKRPVEEIAIPSPPTPVVAAPSPPAAEKNDVHVDKDEEGSGRTRKRLEPLDLRARASRGACSSYDVHGARATGSAVYNPMSEPQQSQEARSLGEPDAASVTSGTSSSFLARAPGNATSALSGGPDAVSVASVFSEAHISRIFDGVVAEPSSSPSIGSRPEPKLQRRDPDSSSVASTGRRSFAIRAPLLATEDASPEFLAALPEACGDASPRLVAPSSPIKTIARVGVASVARARAGSPPSPGRDPIAKGANGSIGAEQITNATCSSVKISDVQSLHYLSHSAAIVDRQPTIQGQDAASLTSAGSRPYAAQSTSGTVVSEDGSSIVPGEIPMVPSSPLNNVSSIHPSGAVTLSSWNISQKRIAAMVGAARDDGRGQDGAVERLDMSDARHATELSWDYQQSRRGAGKAGDSFARPVGKGETSEELRTSDDDDPPEITSIPTDEVMDSFMKDPSGESKKGRSSLYSYQIDEKEGIGRSSDTRDQYQLGRLRARMNWRQEARPSKAWQYDEEDDENTKALRHSRIKTVRDLYTSHRVGGDDEDDRDDDYSKAHIRDQERQHVGLARECHAPLISEANSVHDMSSITHSKSPRPGAGSVANRMSSSTAATGGPSSAISTGDLTDPTLAKSKSYVSACSVGSGEPGPTAGHAGSTKPSSQRGHPSIAIGKSFRSVTSVSGGGSGDGGGGLRSATERTVSTAPSLHRSHPFIADSKSSRSVASAAAGGGGSRSSIADRTNSTAPSLQHGRAIISQSLTSSASGAEIGEAAPSAEGRGTRMPPRSPMSPRSSASTRPPRSPTSSASGAPQSLLSQPHSQKQLQAQTPAPNVLPGSSTPRSISHRDGEDSSFELSEYRGKVFAKMLHLLHDLSPAGGGHVRGDSDASEMKDRIIDEGRASSCSIAELKLIQKLTEEEMSRILHEFETNNSLIERREARALRNIPNLKDGSAAGDDLNGDNGDFHQVEGPGVDEEEKEKSALDSGDNDNDRPPPEKIMYRHDGSGMLSISSKLSDVTSPTCHDGFELDEIIPAAPHHSHHQTTTPVSRPMQLFPKSGNSGDYNVHHKKRQSSSSSFSLPSPLSPVAAAAASVAATMSLSASGTNSRKEKHLLPNSEQQHLSCVLEIPDEIRPSEDRTDSGSLAGNAEGKQCNDKEVGEENNSKSQHCDKKPSAFQAKTNSNAAAYVARPHVKLSSGPGADNIVSEMCGAVSSQKHERLINNAPAPVSEAISDQQEYEANEGEQKSCEESTSKSRVENKLKERGGGIEKREEAENKLKDDIAKEAASRRKAAAGFLASSRKRAQRMVREEHFHDDIMSAVAKAREKEADAELDEVTMILSKYEEVAKQNDGAKDKLMRPENGQAKIAGSSVDMNEVTPLDGLNPSFKKVTFVEPPPMPEGQVMCGCAIQ